MAMRLDDLLKSTYAPDGMGPQKYNCWGLVRAGLHGLFGLPLLPEFGAVRPDDGLAMTSAWASIQPMFKPCRPEPGAMACFYEGALMVHVGLVIERRGLLWVLHINQTGGPVQTPVSSARRLGELVRFYRYTGEAA